MIKKIMISGSILIKLSILLIVIENLQMSLYIVFWVSQEAPHWLFNI